MVSFYTHTHTLIQYMDKYTFMQYSPSSKYTQVPYMYTPKYNNIISSPISHLYRSSSSIKCNAHSTTTTTHQQPRELPDHNAFIARANYAWIFVLHIKYIFLHTHTSADAAEWPSLVHFTHKRTLLAVANLNPNVFLSGFWSISNTYFL